MKGYDKGRTTYAANIKTDQVFEGFDDTEQDRPHKDSSEERARKIARLKAQIHAGKYEPDVMDIARLLTSAMDPTL